MNQENDQNVGNTAHNEQYASFNPNQPFMQTMQSQQKIQDITEEPSFINISQTPQRIFQTRQFDETCNKGKNTNNFKGNTNETVNYAYNPIHYRAYPDKAQTSEEKAKNVPFEPRKISHSYQGLSNSKNNTQGSSFELTKEQFVSSLLNKGFIQNTLKEINQNHIELPLSPKKHILRDLDENGEHVEKLRAEIEKLKTEKLDRERQFQQAKEEMSLIKSSLKENRQFLSVLKKDMCSNIQYYFPEAMTVSKQDLIGKLDLQKAKQLQFEKNYHDLKMMSNQKKQH